MFLNATVVCAGNFSEQKGKLLRAAVVNESVQHNIYLYNSLFWLSAVFSVFVFVTILLYIVTIIKLFVHIYYYLRACVCVCVYKSVTVFAVVSVVILSLIARRPIKYYIARPRTILSSIKFVNDACADESTVMAYKPDKHYIRINHYNIYSSK